MPSYLKYVWVFPAIGCTVSYLSLLWLTFDVLMPGLQRLFGDYQNFGSLVFLPHAVRILAAYLYGWRAVPLLLPAVLGEHVFLYGISEFTVSHAGVSLSSIICGPAAFHLLALAGLDLRRRAGRKVKWPDLVIAASIAAAMDSVVAAVLLGNDLLTTSAWFLGDVIGLLVTFLLLRGFFTLRRRVENV